MVKFCQSNNASLGCLALLVACTLLAGGTQAMTNDEQQLLAVEQHEIHESPISRIAPGHMNLANAADTADAGDIQTIVKQLKAGGVVIAEQKDREPLSYKQLARLLSLWHITQNRNYYEANGDELVDSPPHTIPRAPKAVN